MRTGKPSYTAEMVALFRAAHQILDDDPKILEDPLALKLLGEDTEAVINSNLELHEKPYIVRSRTLAALRSRFMEDELLAAIDRGVTQYVVLGAGLDTSAYRAPPALQKISIYEVDHPDTQGWKLERLADAGIRIPANVRHLPVDFSRQSVADGLSEHGFDPEQTTFFSWLGVTYYLHPEAVNAMFEYAAGFPPGSQLIFDFLIDASLYDERQKLAYERITKIMSDYQEPWKTAFIPEELISSLKSIGFSNVFYLSHELATQRYLQDRQDGLNLAFAMQVMSAIV